MIDWSRTYHTGLVVEDIEAAKTFYENSMGLRFTETKVFDPLPFWTPEQGSHEVVVHACYSQPGPNHLELCQGTGAFYSVTELPDSRHVGVWVDDVAAEAERLSALGWQPLAAGSSPEEGYGSICYLRAPVGQLVVELVSTELEAFINDWLATAIG